MARDRIDHASGGDNVEKGGYVGNAGGRKKGMGTTGGDFPRRQGCDGDRRGIQEGDLRVERRREGEIVGGVKGAVIVTS